MRVLLVEDTPRLAEAVAEILRKSGYGADVAQTGFDGLDMATSGAYDVVLLDIMLPDMSGMDLLRDLRAAGETVPVILLTARQGVGDRVAGLDAGADDYLPKPFHASELLARIRAVTRRPATYCARNAIEACGMRLDGTERTVACTGNSEALELTERESQLLEALMRRAGSAVARSALMARVWGPTVCTARTGSKCWSTSCATSSRRAVPRRVSRRCAVWDIAWWGADVTEATEGACLRQECATLSGM